MMLLRLATLAVSSTVMQAAMLPSEVRITAGAVNAVRIRSVAIYAAPAAADTPKHILLTHARREVVAPAEPALKRGAAAIVPAAEQQHFANPAAFWEAFERERFHDYAQRSTKVPTRPIAVSRGVRGGDSIEIDGLRFDVVDSPGFTPGAVSYLVTIGATRMAFTGDLILSGGRLADLYSLQDAIPEAKARGYHGYAARAGLLIASLRGIAAAKPDVIVPARGPVITDPTTAISQLIRRVQALMASHFSTDALLWYWGPDNLRVRSASVLDGSPVKSMPMAEQKPLPAWMAEIANSRLVISRNGGAFLIDAGYRNILKTLQTMQSDGRFTKLEGIWVTHYHDDHTDHAQAVSEHFNAPVYTSTRMADILGNPSRYRMPCLTTAPIRAQVQPEGKKLRWHEFELTFHDFPGQTLYHGGLHIRRNSGEEVFFVGDSFTPSGIDDYCLYNRNILRGGEGYVYCLDLLRRYPAAWLINQHVAPMFRFSDQHYREMRSALFHRMGFVDELSPWPDRNFMLDESWARIYPYGQEIAPGEFTVALRILNHAPGTQRFEISWNAPPGTTLITAERRLDIAARTEKSATARFRADKPGLYVLTASLRSGSHELPEWTEAIVRVR